MNIASWFCRHRLTEQLPSGPTCRIFFCTRCGVLRRISVPCQHSWVEIERVIVRPVTRMRCGGGEYTENMWFQAQRDQMELAQGKTTIVYRCSVCQEHHTIAAPGVAAANPPGG